MNSPMKRSIIYISAFILTWALWFFMCPNYLRTLEGFDFFTALPDFSHLNLEIPKSGFMGISAFLLQFYAFPAVGAAIHALLTILQVLCVDAVIRTLFKNSEKLNWISYLAAPFFTILLCKELALTGALICLSVSAVTAIVVRLATLKTKPFIPLPKSFSNCWLGIILTLLSIAASGFIIYTKQVKTGMEKMTRLNHLVAEQEWEEILKIVKPKEAFRSEYPRKCALLALIQTDQLADKAFVYGLSGINDYCYKEDNMAMRRNFNMNFYRNLNMYSPAIYYSYQLATQFLLGMSFNSARSLAEIYLEVKDYALAKKYLEILSKSTCHGKWVKERLPELESIKDATPDYVTAPSKGVFSLFQHDLPLMMSRHPEDSRYIHMYLCGLLAEKECGLFYETFCNTVAADYAAGAKMPRIYQEAMTMALSGKPEEMMKYNFDQDILNRFADFVNLLRSGKDGVAKRKYADTYWVYLNFVR